MDLEMKNEKYKSNLDIAKIVYAFLLGFMIALIVNTLFTYKKFKIYDNDVLLDLDLFIKVIGYTFNSISTSLYYFVIYPFLIPLIPIYIYLLWKVITISSDSLISYKTYLLTILFSTTFIFLYSFSSFAVSMY